MKNKSANQSFPGWAGPIVGPIIGLLVSIDVNKPSATNLIYLASAIVLGFISGLVVWYMDLKKRGQ